MSIRTALSAALLFVATVAQAQSAKDHIAMGDRERAANNLSASLSHYEAAVKAEPGNYEALWKASRDAVELGEFDASAERRTALYRSAEQYARQAVKANPGDAEGHFSLARALGRAALTLGKQERVKYAGEVHDQALQALKANPRHGGALHVMGVWNAEIMRLSGFSRFMAKNVLGGKTFGEANWKDAVRYMEAAVAAEPSKITHHLDLAAVYEDMGNKAKARTEYEWIAKAPPIEYNDKHYQRLAAERAAKLR
ncbi:MAG TPA: hypothetical protein VGD77_06180 [Gemmatimonadaceae bacterium]